MVQRKFVFLGAAISVLVTGIAFAVGILSLPPGPVTVSHGPWNAGSDSTIDITLSDVPPGYDVENGQYPGWCVEDNFQPDYSGPGVILLDSTDTDPLECDPNDYPGYPWDKINYLLNNKNGTIEDIQVAMWLLTGTYSGTFTETQEATDMYDDAQANGGGFVPGPGEIAAVVLCVDGNSGSGTFQDTLIELELPPMDGQGCTPGYWKQRHHLFAWVPTGYSPDDNYGNPDGPFPVDDPEDLTLLEALKIGGGGVFALYRHSTAALLNAAHPDVNYAYTVDEVIDMVWDAYESGDYESYKDMFDDANNAGCPLGNGGPGGPGGPGRGKHRN